MYLDNKKIFETVNEIYDEACNQEFEEWKMKWKSCLKVSVALLRDGFYRFHGINDEDES